jgi:His-Xaa-Ser system radical SAM maturase HxsC
VIPLHLPAIAEAERPYVARVCAKGAGAAAAQDVFLVDEGGAEALYAGREGLLAIEGLPASELEGDVLLVHPKSGRAERLLRGGSPHNTLLVTERCDQLCVMCSQPPKKTHEDRFAWLTEACLLAQPGTLIGISGGEPTLYKEELLALLERVLTEREDLEFHVLSNGQHFEEADITRLRSPLYRRVSWGIPLYAPEPALHDEIVGKAGAFARLEESFAYLLSAGARIELRTVLLSPNLPVLGVLAVYVTTRLRFIEAWSIMQLENIGFARNRWADLYVDHRSGWASIGDALDKALLHGIRAQLFNFARCTVPPAYRALAPASISDWKRKYLPACASCRERDKCCGFFEWHPDDAGLGVTPL